MTIIDGQHRQSIHINNKSESIAKTIENAKRTYSIFRQKNLLEGLIIDGQGRRRALEYLSKMEHKMVRGKRRKR